MKFAVVAICMGIAVLGSGTASAQMRTATDATPQLMPPPAMPPAPPSLSAPNRAPPSSLGSATVVPSLPPAPLMAAPAVPAARPTAYAPAANLAAVSPSAPQVEDSPVHGCHYVEQSTPDIDNPGYSFTEKSLVCDPK